MSYTYTGANLESAKSSEASGAPTGLTQLIPTMTSDTAPSGTASASVNNTDAWKALTTEPSPGPGGWSGGLGASWTQYQFGSGYIVTAYSLGNSNGYTFDLVLAGSNDGSSWTTLDTQTVINSLVYTTFSNSTSYSYYRITWNNYGIPVINSIKLYA